MLDLCSVRVAKLGCSILLISAFTAISCNAQDLYNNEWAVQIEGGYDQAKLVAERNGFTLLYEIMPDHYAFHHHKVSKRSTLASEDHHNLLAVDSEVLWLEQQRILKRKKRDISVHFNDAYWKKQWYLYRRTSDGRSLDMNILPAWNQGITGRGVVVTILDDGIEKDHPDLRGNYDPRASKDVNGRDMDPSPRYEYTNENRHGTRCAGEVAASANNSICGVGIAYEANIGGIRMLDGDVTDTVEASSLSYNRDHIDIYSASWGPDDDGKTVDGPGSLARKAFREGIILGRRGKGSLFVWASGNGGRDKDNCNCDGYTNSIYTLSISSATENGHVPWYSEACSSTLASTYSSGGPHEQQIVTTDLRQTCTEEHTGTSASAPLAAGIVALVLQANPSLTWRDMQYLVVMSSNPNNLQADDWVVNGVGRRVSHHFGYGIMNAGKMVELAKNWTSVPPQRICEIVAPDRNRVIHSEGKVAIKLKTNGCKGTSHYVQYLEHVQAKISLTSSFRGDVTIYLTSPMGTKSTLLSPRANDNNNKGFNEWEFMTTHNWGEFSGGEWILEIENGVRASNSANLLDWNLVLFGTSVDPLELSYSRRKELVRKMKTRDHDPNEGDSLISTSLRENMAQSGIILPNLEWMIEDSKPEAHVYKPPVYNPADRPEFEYITSNEGDGGKGSPKSFGNSRPHSGFSDWSEDIFIETRGKYTTTVATLREFVLILHGTDDAHVAHVADSLFTGSSMVCSPTQLLYRNECVEKCPPGWYSSKRLCQPCHVSCASCISYTNSSCTECYYGSLFLDGGCLSVGNGIKIDAGASVHNSGLAPDTLWWLMVGATIAVCMLVIFLVLLSIYYAYTQRYLCSDIDLCCTSAKTSASVSSNTDTTSDGRSAGATPEHIVLTSQNSSQQELMTSSEDEDEYGESRKLRRYLHHLHHEVV